MDYSECSHQKLNCEKRVAVYCRVSTDKDDQSNSFESQKRYFSLYVQSHPDWKLIQIFADEGLSGTNTKKRKAFQQMIACAKNGEFDLIVTKEISRFARNTLDSIYYTRELKKFGVGVLFMNDGINTLDGDAELRLTILSSIAQEESRKTSERVKWGQKRQMEKGVVFGHSLLGYDVHDGKLYINEEGANTVRLIFHKFVDEGKGTHVIARELQEAGIRPMRVNQWQGSVILRILRNEKYCGDLVQKKTFTPDYLSHDKKYNRGQEDLVILRDHHEPIISRELFNQANQMLDQRSSSPRGHTKYSDRYALSGKIKCGYCGSSYVARYKIRKDGSQYKAWRCLEASRHGSLHFDQQGNRIGCPAHSIRNEIIISILDLAWKSLCFDYQKMVSHLMRIIKMELQADISDIDDKTWKQQMDALERERLELINDYLSGRINKEKFLSAKIEYDQKITFFYSNMKDSVYPFLNSEQKISFLQIETAITNLLTKAQFQEEFYPQLLENIIVYDNRYIDVQFSDLPFFWRYAIYDY